jgi:hypothetical protein
MQIDTVRAARGRVYILFRLEGWERLRIRPLGREEENERARVQLLVR